MSRVVSVNVLPGEPTDGTGRVCVHLFIQDEAGSFIEPHALHPAVGEDGAPVKGKYEARPTRGRLACNRRRDPSPVTRGKVTTVTPRTDDPRAVSCTKCKASPEYAAIMERLKV